MKPHVLKAALGPGTRAALAAGIALALAVLLAACGGSSPAAPAGVGTPTQASLTQAAAVVAAPTAPARAAPASPTPPQLAAGATPAATATAPAQPASPAKEQAGAALVARLGGQAWDRLVALTEQTSPRTSATERERAAADYLVRQFQAMGYPASLQSFDARVLATDPPVLAVDSPGGVEVRAVPMRRSGLGVASGALVDIAKALEDDLKDRDLRGKIALIERGTVTFQEKVNRAARAGAVGAVIYNNQPGPFGGTLVDDASIPAVAISQEDGGALLRLLPGEEVRVTLSVVIETRQSRNVIAEKKGTAGDGRVVVLGGHYDTVPDVPGANDNGSGIATLLTIAGEVAGRTYPFTLRFVAFGSEELGLLGSGFYVQSLGPDGTKDTVAMLNFDALATGAVTGVLGDFKLMDDILAYGAGHGIPVERRLTLGGGSSSDHASFSAADIPVVFFLADDFSRIHTADDRLEFVRPDLMGSSAALAIGLLDILAARGP